MQIPFILMTLVALAIIVLLVVFLKKGKPQPLTPLTSLAFVLIVAGIIGNSVLDNRFISYGLFGLGVVLAVIDIALKARKQK
jgi:lipoprotein signal peptidase